MGEIRSLYLPNWTEHPGEVREYYDFGERWMAKRGKPRLSALGYRLWEIAAANGTITYSALAAEFELGRRGRFGVGMFSGLVAAYCETVMGHVFLSCVLVKAGSQTADHPKGLPAEGGWWNGAPVAGPSRVKWALERQARVWTYCSTHPNPFAP